MAQQEIHRKPNGTFGKGTIANPAARWLADYILGKPVEQVNITGEETPDVILRLPTIQPSANGNGADGSDDGNAD